MAVATNLERKTLTQQIDGPIALVANISLQRTNDVPYTFRQDSNFWYYTGIHEPGCVLVMASGDEYLILPKKNEIQKIFDGVTDIPDLKRRSGIENIYEYEAGWDNLKKLIKKHKKVNMLLPKKQFGMAINPATNDVMRKIKRAVPTVAVNDISKQVARQRMVKTEYEIKNIQRAIDITNQTLKDVFTDNWHEKYQNESEIARDLHIGYLQKGASGHAFEPIVASGKNACTIHYVKNDSTIARNFPLLVDTGAEFMNYAADISRTYLPVNASTRQKEIYLAVREVADFARSIMQPGALMRDIEQQVEKRMGEVLIELGLIKINEAKEVRKYYPHAVSHHLGLDVHDLADYSVPLAENMVITVEPGIYIKQEGIGIRIEDDVLITNTGNKLLSA